MNESERNAKRSSISSARLRGFGIACVVVCFVAMTIPVVKGSFISDLTGVDINIPEQKITISPPNLSLSKLVEALKNAPNDALHALLPGANALAFEMRRARAQGYPNAKPIPEPVRRFLAHYYPDIVLDRARYLVFDPNRITLDTVLLSLRWDTTSLGDLFPTATAVTVGDLIVFQGQVGVQDPALWAHELVHVAQYANMGYEAFAYIYITRHQELEEPGYEMGSRVAAKVRETATCWPYLERLAKGGAKECSWGKKDPCLNCCGDPNDQQRAVCQNACGEITCGANQVCMPFVTTEPGLGFSGIRTGTCVSKTVQGGSSSLEDSIRVRWEQDTNPGIRAMAQAVGSVALERSLLGGADAAALATLANSLKADSLDFTLSQLETDLLSRDVLRGRLTKVREVQRERE